MTASLAAGSHTRTPSPRPPRPSSRRSEPPCASATSRAIGLLGIFMRRFEWPRPAFLVGFVIALGAFFVVFLRVRAGVGG